MLYIDDTYMCNILIGSILKSIFDPNEMIFTTTMLEMLYTWNASGNHIKAVSSVYDIMLKLYEC